MLTLGRWRFANGSADSRQPWFIAKGVCDVLGVGNVSQALSSLDDDEKGSITTKDGTPGSPVRATINESGLYSLILRSRKPEAKACDAKCVAAQ